MRIAAPHPPAEIPRFVLYGENTSATLAEAVHIELIETRSRLHNWHIGTHTHAGLFQVLFLFGGQVCATVDEEKWDCRGPVVITIHPSVAHGFDFTQDAYGYVLTVDQNLMFSATMGQTDLYAALFVEALAIDLTAQAGTQARLEPLLQQLMTEMEQRQHGHALMLEWLARSILLLLLRAAAEQRLTGVAGRCDFELFSQFRTQVELHFKQQWPVEQYAALLRVTPTRLTRLCVKLSGKSAYRLTQDRLILEACRQLRYVPHSIASIAYELGFLDPAYFSRLFKKRTGLTPQDFRAAPAP